MHRFRKKSDASTKRAQFQGPQFDLGSSDFKPLRSSPVLNDPLPELPPASNFRTSLILPDLTRRFTLLRSSSGQPLSIEDLRQRFADQRARGAEHQISEEEEEMIIQSLGRIRGNANGNNNGNAIHARRGSSANGHESLTSREGTAVSDSNGSYERSSVRSSNTVTPSSTPSASIRSSSSSRSARRYSNNLFGSGRMRDYNYRNQKGGAIQRNAAPVTPTGSNPNLQSNSMYSDHSVRSVTPDGDSSVLLSSVQTTPNSDVDDRTPVVRSAPLNPPAPYTEHSSSSTSEYGLSKALNPAALKRASMAMEEVLKEIEEEMEEDIEEEAEDEIVMPRSPPLAARPYHSSQSDAESPPEGPQSSATFEAGTAISSDKHISDAEVERSSPVPSRRSVGTTSPTPRLPGYIPGMPRPMTPRDPSFDSDDQSRSHSTTPRPTSPLLPGLNGHLSPHTSIAAGLMRRDSNTSPAYSSRNANAAFSYDEQRGSADITIEDALSSPLGGGRRRPASPLAGPAFQPMAVSSRPGTPSNVTWNTSTSSFSSKSRRSRGGSMSTDESGVLSDQSAPGRSLRSPVMPDSPTLDREHSTTPSAVYGRGHYAAIAAAEQSMSENRSSPAISNFELGSPIAIVNRTLHSPTPTQNRSPAPQSMSTDVSTTTSPNASRRTSRQNGPSSSFSLAPTYPLVFSPMANSSRSSIASEGSSYHSDDGSRRRDRDHDLFIDVDTQYSVWHDVSSTEMTSPATHGDSQDEWDAEDIINRYAGLTKSDFVAIQEKLVSAAVAKAATPDPRDRAPSLRRRRPSTSQSNYSLNGRENRVTSPPPQAQNSGSHSSNADNAVRAKILESVVDSIKSSPNQPTNNEPAVVSSQQQRELSPSSRRTRDLARALFGGNSQDASPATLSSSEKSPKMAYHHPSPSSPALVERSPTQTRLTAEDVTSATSPASPYPMSLSRNTSILRSPRTPLDQTELAREVQRKTEAATASLKRGASTKYHDANASTTSVSLTRKRIAPHQISAPHLVSASTSVDTIPLRSPSVSSGNASQQKPGKLGQRLRKWGTLRAKPTIPNGDEITPFPLDAQSARSPPSVQHAHYNTPNINIPEAPASASLTESGRSRVPVPSPPATAGPGLKGFMSRFRKPRTADTTTSEFGRRSVDQDRPPAASPTPSTPLSEYVFPKQSQPQSAPAIKSSFQSPVSRVAPPSSMQSTPPTSWNGSSTVNISQQPETTANPNDTALKQLFDAASNLGLDQTALNDLLARSGSTSSRSTAGWNMLTRNNSAVTNSRSAAQNDNSMDRARSPTSEGRSSMDGFVERKEDNVTNNVIPRKRVQPARTLPDGQDDTGTNAVVRRTIIFPSDSRTSTIDLNILMRKNSQSARRRRSAGTASVTSSSRSVHDRAPTPPPPRSPTGRRFSQDASPPVPQLPVSFSAQAESLLPTPRSTPATPIEKSSSAYDSLYEMYAGERAASTGLSDNEASPHSHPDAEGGRAVEVIELANGETIWSIVNGLRDEDAESLYASRTSFGSDYSTQQPHADGVQVLFKEHSRAGSKGSNSSFLSRKRLGAGKNRPETKVFYSSSNQIGRLIENLSEGQEAGSFNFKPTKRPGHSTSSSFQSEADVHWTVEERLEHLLGSMGNP